MGLLQPEVLYAGSMKHFIHQKELVTLLPSVLNVSVNSVAADQSREGWQCWKPLGFVLSTSYFKKSRFETENPLAYFISSTLVSRSRNKFLFESQKDSSWFSFAARN